MDGCYVALLLGFVFGCVEAVFCFVGAEGVSVRCGAGCGAEVDGRWEGKWREVEEEDGE